MQHLENTDLTKDQIYRSTKKGHIRGVAANIKYRSKLKNIPHDIDSKYLDEIATDCCPVFGIEFVWGRQRKGHGPETNSPTLDRIIPELGYVRGNVVFISDKANRIKQEVTEKELYAVADWLHDKRKEVQNAFKDKHSSVPGACDTPGRKVKAHWAVS